MSDSAQPGEQATLSMVEERSGQADQEDQSDGPETKTETLTLTVRAKLETSQRKRRLLRDRVEEWQAILAYAAEMMPAVDHWNWGAQSTPIRHVVNNEFAYPDEADEDERVSTIPRHAAYQAGYKVGEAFEAWHERGRSGKTPQGEWGSGDFMRFCGCCHDESTCFIAHGGGRYGIKVKHSTTGTYQPNETEWLGIFAPSDYQQEKLDAIASGEASMGAFEVRLGDPCYIHIPVKTDVEVYKVGAVNRWLGVDLGESNVYAAAVIDDTGDIVSTDDGPQVRIESGDEFREYRDRLSAKQSELGEKGDRRGLIETKGLRENYTDYMNHNYAVQIVELAERNAPVEIVLEDLTGYRESAFDPIHDWPHNDLKEKIVYKATQAGIPVKADIDPAGTSVTCPECGDSSPEKRISRDEFYCRRSDYGPLNADLVSARNIAGKRI
jgi:IS605 OrfB family transposase